MQATPESEGYWARSRELRKRFLPCLVGPIGRRPGILQFEVIENTAVSGATGFYSTAAPSTTGNGMVTNFLQTISQMRIGIVVVQPAFRPAYRALLEIVILSEASAPCFSAASVAAGGRGVEGPAFRGSGYYLGLRKHL